MSYFKIIGFTAVALVAIILLKRVKDEYALFISLFSGISLTLAAFGILEEFIRYMQGLASPSVSRLSVLIMKSAGIAVITAIACDLCRDCGENTLASRLELCAKAVILSLALPLIKELFDSCTRLLE